MSSVDSRKSFGVIRARPTALVHTYSHSDARKARTLDGPPVEWHSDRMLTVVAQDAPRPWTDIPAVAVVGLVIGLVIIWAAIRYMLGKRK